MRKLSKPAKAKPRKSRRKAELYFVIGGGISRTKCATEKDAIAHATRLLQQRNDDAVTVGCDLSNGPDTTILMHAQQVGKSWRAAQVAEYVTIPKIETQQCVGNSKPLYIVKVVGIAELVPPPVKVRQPKGDELA